jgi:hypothetical protein
LWTGSGCFIIVVSTTGTSGVRHRDVFRVTFPTSRLMI